ncbi:MAG: MopE-related protein [Polyangiales bacterium]|nr:hypothetical protein [Myxococcales bacterium]MCB9657144.1 hypothetical protein [Sandaracinaceae bacterium]
MLALLAAAAGVSGCSVPLDANPNYGGCARDEDCNGLAEMCHRGFCISAACEDDTPLACYTAQGADGGMATPRGVCRPGTRACVDGSFGPCRGQVLPGIETCNGLNDDCDDNVDEQPEASCETGQMGACNAGMPVCQGADVVCRRVSNPTSEICDGIDNDCDGEMDEDAAVHCFPSGALGCTETSPGKFVCQGVCVAGTSTCDSGTPGTCSGHVIAQTGDGCTTAGTAVDDDCDGLVDEDCDTCGTPGSTQVCYGGPPGTIGVGACATGAQTCLGDGSWTPCSAAGPEAETCANMSTGDDPAADNDCNGVTDDIEGRNEPCVGDGQGRCALGEMDCVDDALTCVSPDAIAELCNGIDDDCNGAVDNGFDLLSDEANCGTCGLACANGLECCNGKCVNTAVDGANCGTCGSAAGDGLTCCAGRSADLDSDALNCGACGRACGEGRQCCGGTCVDTARNADHCGMCGAECDAGQACCQGGCRAPSSPLCQGCPTDCSANGESCCMGSCVDTQTDEQSCGSCGNACDPGELCCGGTCVPDDAANCGTCGNSCGSGSLCCDGACVANNELNCGSCGNFCASGQGCCDNACTSLGANPDHCGSCGNDCTAGQTCTGGVCCGPGLTGCGGACVDTDTDEAHCGGCNNVCGNTCTDGRCCFLVFCS